MKAFGFGPLLVTLLIQSFSALSLMAVPVLVPTELGLPRLTPSGIGLYIFYAYAGAMLGTLSAGALAAVTGFFQALGKQVIVIDDAPGMVVMRTVAMLANEAAEVVQQGIASVQDTDLAMVNGVNYPRGPLAWADAIGPAVIQRVLANLAATYGEERYRSSPLLARRALTGQPFYREHAQ